MAQPSNVVRIDEYRAAPLLQAAAGSDVDGVRPDAAWGALMALAQAGDTVAYHALLVAVTPYIRAIARRRLPGREDAEDAVQDILLTLHRIRHTYEPGRPFKPWLATLALRRAIDASRRHSRSALRSGTGVEGCEAMADLDEAGPEANAALQEGARALRDALARLPPGQREAVELLQLKELNATEAARVSRQSAVGLRVAYHRALKTLRVALGGNAGVPPHE